MGLNDEIADRITGRAVRLVRFTAAQTREALKLYRSVKKELVDALRELSPVELRSPTLQQKRLAKLVSVADEIVKRGMKDIELGQKKVLEEVAEIEAAWFAEKANAVIGVELVTATLSRQQIKSIVSDVMIEGAPSREWWNGVSSNVRRAFVNTVRSGMVKGLTTDEIVADLVGTDEQPGVLDLGRRQVEALVRTSIQTVANDARLELYEENQDVLKGIEWLATLDNRTTIICMGLHGKAWTLPDYEPIGHDIPFPGPTAHWGCRSTQVPVFKSWEEISGKRVVRTEAGGRTDIESAFEKNLLEQGFSRAEARKIMYQARASMDGEIPKAMTFDEWLRGKSKAFQDELLGPGRAELFREGKITLSDLLDQRGRPLTLEQLREKYGEDD